MITPLPRALVIFQTFILSFSLFIFIAAMKPIAQGYWFQTQTPLLFLSILSTLALLSFFVALFQAPQPTLTALQHPATLLPLALAILGILAAPFTHIPLLTFFGNPELGEGVFWFLCISILSASMQWISPNQQAKRIIGWVALSSLSINALLITFAFKTRFGIPFQLNKPYYFDDYLAFSSLFLVLILVHCWQIHTRKKWFYALLTYCTWLLFIADNKAALALWIVGLPFTYGIFWLIRKTPFLLQRKLAVIATLLAPLVLWTTLAILNHQSIIKIRQHETLWSRYQLSHVVLQSLKQHPSAWLTGQGWGSYTDASIGVLDIERSPLHQGDAESQHTLWEFLFDRSPFHSHNEIMEALLSTGILGMLLMWLWYGLPPFLSTAQTLPIATLIGSITLALGSLWFQMPTTIPFMAIALGSLPAPKKVFSQFKPNIFFYYLLFILLIPLMSWGIYHQAKTILNDRPLKSPPPYQETMAKTCGDDLIDFNQGGYLLVQYFRDLESRFKSMTPEAHRTNPVSDQLQWMHCVVDRQWQHNPSFRLMASDLITYSDWAFYTDDPSIIPSWAFYGWEEKIQQWLSVLPHRTDLIAPYFMWQLSRGHEATIQPLINQILSNNPNDPIGLWFSGITLLNHDDTANMGKRRMQRALSLGLGRILLVDPTIIEALKEP